MTNWPKRCGRPGELKVEIKLSDLDELRRKARVAEKIDELSEFEREVVYQILEKFLEKE